MNYFAYIFFIIIAIIVAFLVFYIKEGFESLTFSNTEKWGIKELSVKRKISKQGKKIMKELPYKPFPSNYSLTTKAELKNILKKQENIDETMIKKIREELDLNVMVDRFKIAFTDKKSIIYIIVNHVDPIIMNLKERYNRVRPYILNKKIKALIDPPKHPSYPSGHSVQAYFIAYMLINKYPNNEDFYLSIADDIAVNREYAGVHYESDTKYGKEIAKILCDKFKNEYKL